VKIAILLSGGVDSSVALALLEQQGHELTAFYIKIWLEDELAYLGSCPWQEDLDYAQKACDKLNVPLKVISLQQEYHDRVVRYTISEVAAGRTPSPDVLCNQFIKFGCFYDKIDKSFEKVASGHYAQVEELESVRGQNKFILKKAKDSFKDQTYFLSRMSQQQLARVLFPIGHLLKSEVRELAHKFDLPTQSRKDSQGICFLGKIKFSDFIRHHLKDRPGDLVEFETGDVVGKHEGFWYYTVGQRKGIGLSGGPWFVVKKDVANNIVYISKDYYSEEKLRDTFNVSDFHWISGQWPNESSNLDVKIRHGENLYRCSIDFIENGCGCVKIHGCDQGIAPGQFAVFYVGDICLGSAVICYE
jgi:tRNA-specific 2-thiouridylase